MERAFDLTYSTDGVEYDYELYADTPMFGPDIESELEHELVRVI